ncbi:hypothetical protein RvY_08834 [Ramazzottius varieornatus]|uniref:Uncharacterized protein n=1 Tax=Ramazzottius varieornatus TaxID=947166 RepID=A0A1D1V9H1_RAMVA|nr:hypothetical protein RvY_08834 [Ramazzottius varieornatus]
MRNGSEMNLVDIQEVLPSTQRQRQESAPLNALIQIGNVLIAFLPPSRDSELLPPPPPQHQRHRTALTSERETNGKRCLDGLDRRARLDIHVI